MFQGNLDSETKLQLSVVALQVLDWRCKHLTQRLRSCLRALALCVPTASSTSEQAASLSSTSPQPLNIILPSVTDALSTATNSANSRCPAARPIHHFQRAAGTPPGKVFIPPPQSVLFSWLVFLQNGKDVRLCFKHAHAYKRC